MKIVEPPLTPQQRAALEARDRSVSLAAGAGCGKTFVLTERFITQLEPAAAGNAADLDQLVAITFTDAAAREMRDRIRRRCYQRLLAARTDEEAAGWQRLMRSMDSARISTIHAFCTALLRKYSVEAGLDPQFQVLDAPSAELLRLETIDDRLRALLVERNDDVLELAAHRGLDRLRTDLANFSGPLSAAPIAKWRDKRPEQLVALWLEVFEKLAPELAASELLDSGEIREIRRWANPELAASEKLRAHLTKLAYELTPEQIKGQPLGKSLQTLMELARVQGVCKAADWDNADHHERFKQAAEKLRNLIKKTTLEKPRDLNDANQSAALGLALVRVAADIATALEAAKARRHQLEFDDLLDRAARLLTDPKNEANRKEAVQRTQLIMVDEFQDTNPVQVAIVQAFCGDRWRERGLFAVGDFKQSIYRFNGAEPSVSLRLREQLSPAGRLSLTTNFRSQPGVLDFVNAVFHDAFVDYEPLIAKREQVTPVPCVEFLWSPGPNSDHEGEAGAHKVRRRGATGEARAEEARWIARRLVQLLESPDPIVVDMVDGAATPRRLKKGDVAILLRSLGDAQVYEEALRDVGLDYYLAGGHAFYSQQEIFDVLNLLRAIASEVDEVALAGALRSPLFSLTDETLFWLVEEHDSLNAALSADELPSQLAPADATKVRRAAEAIDRLRRDKDRLLVAELLALAFELTGYDATLLAEFLGPRKAANLEKLLEQARSVDRNSPGDLPGFITQLSEFVTQAPKEALAATQSEGGDVIRIMTIHYAKGLEFPLVVLPDLERSRHRGRSEPVLDDKLGPLVPIKDSDGALGFDLYQRRESIEDLEERKRLFYVACTRAADYLILSSSIDDVDRPKSDWLQLVEGRIGLADGELRGTLPAGYEAPVVRVIHERPQIDSVEGGAPRGADLHRLVVKTRELVAGSPDLIPRASTAIAPDTSARRRFSFSQITGMLTPVDAEGPSSDIGEVDDHEDMQPAYENAGGREFGSLVHAAFQRIEFRRPGEVSGLCHFLAPQFVVHNPEAAADEAARLIDRFLKTPLAAQLAAAATVRREVEFVLPWPPGDSKPGGPYLHGFLDCLFQDGQGRWRLIDYKTNRVAGAGVPQVAKMYEMQMLAYKLACEQALGAPLAECSLVVLQAGVVHSYEWDAAATDRGVQQISSAMKMAAKASS